MTDKKTFQVKPLFSVALTLTGILIGLSLAVLAVWADYEASSYGFLKRAKTPFKGLSCPVFMGKDESGIVSIQVSNPTDQVISPSIRSEISSSLTPDTKIEYLKLAPGEQVTLQRTVGPENIDLGEFIFVSALVYSVYPLPDQQSTCGIFVLPVSRGGSLIVALGTILSVLLMASGLFFLHKNEVVATRSRSLVFMAVVTVLAMFLGFIGWWIQAVILLVVLILMLVISLNLLIR